ncbi:DUF5682 family protein [Streptomyces sp. ICBB 8177]|uniref:DUF5682 family protein n=1 Tax=Streptomyces sp. ICBB 8177 TaxID=563922 RepID=UPI000D67EFA7|nr:DUF5682 family protein [Streptomyces sp. ICBB 8177]PWI44573.1 hypothetical protein CK485_16780 [Streptomyces sp. ICBB 8177]
MRLLGVRHHGPGSARAVRAALDQYDPQVVLVEGPPEADAVVDIAADEGLRPPVALLAHATDEPARSAFWPFAEFSPEWVAIRWALKRGVPVRFIDLPASNSLATRGDWADAGPDEPAGAAPGEDAGPAHAGPAHAGTGDAETEDPVRIDPIAVLAEAAGYDDPERWWEDAVEHRGGAADGGDALAAFEAVAEAMEELRERYGDGGHPRDAVREAHMRLRLREARRAYDRTAVVCGAWHVPALAARTTVAADRASLKGLPKVKAEVTWVPWTHRRLSRDSGYGAGIDSPGWYRHLFGCEDRPVERWMTRVAGLLRAEDRQVSSAHVIEAVRLAETLAAMRGRPLAGLGETTDAVRAVMCEGSDVPLELIRERLVVGDEMGEVPDSAPAVPLARDLARQQRALRLKPEAADRELDLDLRKDTDAGRSRLLHRLRLLGVEWGAPTRSRTAGTGTFRETWRLSWEPELTVRVAEAGVWGTTVESAATAKAEDAAVTAVTLAEVTGLAEWCLLAGLPDALPTVMRVLADRAALDADVLQLAEALPALVRSVRYGDVRETDSGALREVAEGVAVRVCVGLPSACAGLDEDGAAGARPHLDAVHTAVGLLTRAGDELRERWAGTLHALAERYGGITGLIRGRAARLLLDDGLLDAERAARLMGLALSPGTEPRVAAAWVDGFLSGGGMLLLHDERLLGLVDAWLSSVPAEAFTDVLPLVRRTFAGFESGVRRGVGELVRRGTGTAGGSATAPGAAVGFGAGLDLARADAVLPTLRLLLGIAAPVPEGTAAPAPALAGAAAAATTHDDAGGPV